MFTIADALKQRLYKRKSLYGPASKAMVLYMTGMIPLAWDDHAYCDGFIYL